MNWYYAVGREARGPLDDDSFGDLIRAGTVAPDTLIWNETLAGWLPLRSLDRSKSADFAPEDPPPAASAAVPPESIEEFPTAAPASPEPERRTSQPPAARTSEKSPFRFDGRGSDLLLLYLKNLVLTLLTLGIYRFWARVAVYRWVYQHTSFHGARFDYHATGKEKFIGFLKGLLLLSPVVLLLFLLHGLLTSEGVPSELAFILCLYGFFFLMFLLRPLLLVGSLRYNLARTSWSGLRFRFDGRVKECYALYLRDLLFMILTLGFYWSWHHVKVRSFKAHHTLFGGDRFEFRGSGLEFLGLFIGGTMLCYMTFGLFIPWYIAWLTAFQIDNLWFQGKRFKSRLDGLKVLQVLLIGLVVTIGTLGIGLPWAIKNYLEMYVNTIEYTGKLDLDALKGGFDPKASAFVEGIGEAGDALEALAEFFGG